jgi:hypothetical protein
MTACRRCNVPFDPDNRLHGEAAQCGESPWCCDCVDDCHEGDAGHRCVICHDYTTRPDTEAAELAEIGETHKEWGVRFPNDQIEICDDEDDAREWAGNGTLVHRIVIVGKWRPDATEASP